MQDNLPFCRPKRDYKKQVKNAIVRLLSPARHPVLIRSRMWGYLSRLLFFTGFFFTYNTWDRFITQPSSHATWVTEKGWGSKGEQKRHLNLRALVKQRRRSGSDRWICYDSPAPCTPSQRWQAVRCARLKVRLSACMNGNFQTKGKSLHRWLADCSADCHTAMVG